MIDEEENEPQPGEINGELRSNNSLQGPTHPPKIKDFEGINIPGNKGYKNEDYYPIAEVHRKYCSYGEISI